MRILSCDAAPPVLPAEAIERGLLAERSSAADSGDAYRELMLQGLAESLERITGRMWWRGDGGGARRVVTVVEDPVRGPWPLMPWYPLLPDVTLESLEIWYEGTVGGWSEVPADDRQLVPVSRWWLSTAQSPFPVYYRITAEATPAEPPPDGIRAGLARAFAWQDQHRPARSATGGAGPPAIGNVWKKSGAMATLSPWIWRWMV